MDEDNKDEEIKEVYAHFGLTFYAANVLEHSVVDLLVLLEFPNMILECKNKDEVSDIVDQKYEHEFSKTLGRLKKKLQEYGSISNKENDVLNSLNECNSSRDYLAHHFWREYAVDFLSRAGRQKMINHLSYWRKSFEKTERSIYSLSRPIADQFGITEECIEDHIRHMKEEDSIKL